MSKAKPSPTRILRGSPRNLAFLARQLRAGELVAVPTETVYGLAANALDAAACRRIFRAKKRPATDPLIVHLHDRTQLPLVCHVNVAAKKLAAAFWPGPLTLVLPKTDVVPGVVTAGRDSVAVRMPAHALFRRLLRRAGVPLAAPSANPFGYVSPTTAEHVRHGLGGRIKYILDGGPAAIGLESTIVDVRDERTPRLLRPGAITRAQLERALGIRVAVAAGAGKAAVSQAQLAPGMLSRHYSPRTRVVLHERLGRPVNDDDAYVYFRQPAGAKKTKRIDWLDRGGDARRAARRLFAVLRALDAGGFRKIHFELAPAGGIGDAINDRLRRAAAR